MIVPFPPGSATDLAARVIGQQLQSALGKPFIVENKPGAQGTIAGNEVVRAAPDGQTLLFTSNTAIASNVPLMKKMPYDPTKDFAPVAGIGTTALVLMVKPDFPAKNLNEFIAHAKQRPGKLAAGYGSTSSQISISRLSKMRGSMCCRCRTKAYRSRSTMCCRARCNSRLSISATRWRRPKAERCGRSRSPRRSAIRWCPTCDVGRSAAGLRHHRVVCDRGAGWHAEADRRQALRRNDQGADIGRGEGQARDDRHCTDADDTRRAFALYRSEVAKWTRLTKEAGIEPE